MSPVRRLLTGLVGRRWGAECPDGLPVPAAERCAARDCESVPLPVLAEGERGRVTCLEDPAGPAGRKLAGLGVLPGVELELVQRFPAYVFRLGHSEFAVDAELAAHVRVRRA